MIFGQVINVVLPLTLPWTFIMCKKGVYNFGTKMNTVCYFMIYFFGLLFPILYFFQLLQDREAKLIREREKRYQKLREELEEKRKCKIVFKKDMFKHRINNEPEKSVEKKQKRDK